MDTENDAPQEFWSALVGLVTQILELVFGFLAQLFAGLAAGIQPQE